MSSIKAWLHTVAPFTGNIPNEYKTATIGTATTSSGWMIFTPTQDISLTRVAFYVSSVTGGSVTDVMRVSVQTATTTSMGFAEKGKPSGTVVGTSATVATNVLTASANNVVTGLSATLSAGKPYAIVFEPVATWTATAVIKMAINQNSTGAPYVINNWYTGVGTGSSVISGFPVIVFGSSSAWYGHPCPDGTAPYTNQVINNGSPGSNYTQVAIKFTLPVGIDTCKIESVCLNNLRFGWGSADVIYRIMDSTGTTSLQATLNERDATLHRTQVHEVLTVNFPNPLPDISAGEYLFVVESRSGATEVYTMDLPTTYVTGLTNTFAGLSGGTFQYRSTTSGAWTTVSAFNRVCPMSVYLSDIVTTDGGGGSGPGTLTAAPRYTINAGIN